MKRLLLPTLTLLMLGACSPSSLLSTSSAPARLYTLSAPATVTTSAPQASWQLLIATPEAAMDLNIARIAIAPSPAQVDYYSGVAWADRPPAMLQALLLQSFDRSGRIAAVGRQGGSLKSDFVLESDLEAFQVEEGQGEPMAHVRLTARLVRSRDRMIVASRNFESSVPVAGGTFDGAIAGFDAATAEILPQIVDWTLTQGNRNP